MADINSSPIIFEDLIEPRETMAKATEIDCDNKRKAGRMAGLATCRKVR